MTPIEVDESDAPACAFLGLAGDRRSHFTYPHPAHRCFAGKGPQTTDLHRQQGFCLSAEFVTCDRYLAWQSTTATARQPRFPRSRDVGPTSPTPPVGDASPTVIYVFRTGDSLARIATSYALTIDEIVAANNLDPNVPVADGARLVIPIDRPPGDISRAESDGPTAGR